MFISAMLNQNKELCAFSVKLPFSQISPFKTSCLKPNQTSDQSQMKSDVRLNMDWSGQIGCFVYVCLCVRQKRRAAIGLLRPGRPVNRHLLAAGHLAAGQACVQRRTLTPPSHCLHPPTHTRSLTEVCATPSCGSAVTRPDSHCDRQQYVYWLSGNLDRKSISLHFQIFIFKSTLWTVYLCSTTSQRDLFCCNLKRASPFSKIKRWKCLKECKPNAREIIQIQISASSQSKCFL